MRIGLRALAIWAIPAHARRAAENAVLEAGEAFRTSIGRETIGPTPFRSGRAARPT